jgi:hypothetical protein
MPLRLLVDNSKTHLPMKSDSDEAMSTMLSSRGTETKAKTSPS